MPQINYSYIAIPTYKYTYKRTTVFYTKDFMPLTTIMTLLNAKFI